MESYFVSKTKEKGFIGQLTLEEITIRFRSGEILGEYVATKSIGPSYQQLIKSGTVTWISVADLIANTPTQTVPISGAKVESTQDEGMSGGEWLGAFFCTPYALIKYFDWKKEYPRKSKQVCTLYLIVLALNILLGLLQIMIDTSRY